MEEETYYVPITRRLTKGNYYIFLEMQIDISDTNSSVLFIVHDQGKYVEHFKTRKEAVYAMDCYVAQIDNYYTPPDKQ